MPQRHDGRDLDGLENAVVVISLDRLERTQHVAIAGGEAHAPAGHVVALGHRREFAADALGPFDRQETRRLISVEADVAIGEVVNHEEAVLLGKGDDLFKKRPVHDGRRRVVRIVDDQDLGPGVKTLASPSDVRQKARPVPHIERNDVGGSQGDGMDVDRKAGRGHERRIAWARAEPGTCG